jgi:prepilin-type N-terminal cleavage/methylation domain-containing protein
MNKKGFTLIELLVVIVIIGVLSIVIVPSILNINKNINERLLNSKIEEIESGAVLYANNNEEIFNGTDTAYVYVYELVETNYLTTDVPVTDSKCDGTSDNTTKGCVINPTNNESLNNNYIILKKEGVGVTAELVIIDQDPSGDDSVTSNNLVDVICSGFASGKFEGQAHSGGNIVACTCDKAVGATKLVVKGTTTQVNACLIAGDNVNNYLKYGSSRPNWRVLGVYNLDGTLTVKMITSDPV